MGLDLAKTVRDAREADAHLPAARERAASETGPAPSSVASTTVRPFISPMSCEK